MNATARPALADNPAVANARAQADAWWRARTRRERQAVVLMVAAVLVLLVWLIFVAPAWRSIQAAPAELDALENQLQQMQRVASEGRGLRGTAPVNTVQAGLALKSATERLGDKARLTTQQDRAILNLSGVTPEALRAWLGEARAGARARPVEAQLQRGPNGYTGSVTVVLPGQ